MYWAPTGLAPRRTCAPTPACGQDYWGVATERVRGEWSVTDSGAAVAGGLSLWLRTDSETGSQPLDERGDECGSEGADGALLLHRLLGLIGHQNMCVGA
jgi:hypothetical protein